MAELSPSPAVARPTVTAVAKWWHQAADPAKIDTVIRVTVSAHGMSQALYLSDVHWHSLEAWERSLSGSPPGAGPLTHADGKISFDLSWEGDRYRDQLESAILWEFPSVWLVGPLRAAIESLRADGVPFARDDE